MSTVLFSVLALGGMALIFGLGLGYAGVKFKTEEDPRLLSIRDALPGANCGGCGFAGCDAMARAIMEGSASPDACPVIGDEALNGIASLMGISVVPAVHKKAFVKCVGDCNKSEFRYEYQGISSCLAAMQLAGGGCKSCVYGCLGGGSCVTACKFGAVSIVDGIAVVDNEKCTSCGMCAKTCPKHIIEMTPADAPVRVACVSLDTGKAVRAYCKTGCIGCKLCEKACTEGAIHVDNNLAAIDYNKCTACGACAAKCPAKVIKVTK